MTEKEKREKLNKDVASMIKRIDQMQEEIVSKLEEVYQKGNITYYDVEGYLTDQRNFSETQWKFLKREREIWLKKIWDLLGEETKTKHDNTLKKKKAGERKRKTLGGRKKWIPMR